MRKLILKMSMSVDGYVAGPNGETDWQMRSRGPEGAAWVEQTLREAGAHLVGRRTYDQWVGFWPTAPGPMAAPMNDIPKIVFSRSDNPSLEPTADLGWANPRVLGADLAADIATLKAEPGKDLLAQGGVSFAQSLVRLGLVDEYRLLVHPVVLGSGLALFDGAPEFDLELIDSVRFSSGHALLYRPA